MVNAAQQILIFGVRFYRRILSPAKTALLGPAGRCRFEPSCSAYALGALQVHGAVKGSWLALCRLCRCHPWGRFGPDPVPEPKCEVTPNTHLSSVVPLTKEEHATRSEQSFGQSNPSSDCTTENERATAASY